MSLQEGNFMRQRTKLALALLTGFVLGGGAIGALKAQTNKPPAYVVAEVEVTDPAEFQQYAAKVPATLAPYHGRTVVRGKPDTKEGPAMNGNLVVLAFDNLDDAEHWYSSPAYNQIIPMRQRSAKTRLFIVEGLPQ
jgi:uncharacterized protein (DUF1330 family)